jgi:hypothetical protein
MSLNSYTIQASNAVNGVIISGSFTVDPVTNLVQQFFVNNTNVLAPSGVTQPGVGMFAIITLFSSPFVITYGPNPNTNEGFGNLFGNQLFYPNGPTFFDLNGILITDVSNPAIELDAGVPNAVFDLYYDDFSGLYQLSYYSINTGGFVVIPDITITINLTPPPCFKEGSKILCLVNDLETYVNIEEIRKGDLVKTLKHGFVGVNMIATSQIYDPIHDLRIKERMYKLSKDKYVELFEDLYITGCHSVLVNRLSDGQKSTIRNLFGDVFSTDGKYRLMACVDDKADILENGDCFNIWHLALDNGNYAIYANGLMVESCSIRILNEMSNMIVQ